MKEISHKDIHNYIGRTIILERISDKETRRISLTKQKGDIIYGVGVRLNTKIYYEFKLKGDITGSKVYVI